MTAYTRNDLIDSFLCSASLYDPTPTDEMYDALLALAMSRYGKHPTDLDTLINDDLVHEIVHPDED
jgi:hypothetical protein